MKGISLFCEACLGTSCYAEHSNSRRGAETVQKMYLWVIAAATAYFIKGLCGFANTLVLTSILSFGAANANISPIDLLLGYPANLILTWNNRRRLDPKVWLPLAALGLFAGMKCSRVLDEKWVRRITSVLLVLSGVSLIVVNL